MFLPTATATASNILGRTFVRTTIRPATALATARLMMSQASPAPKRRGAPHHDDAGTATATSTTAKIEDDAVSSRKNNVNSIIMGIDDEDFAAGAAAAARPQETAAASAASVASPHDTAPFAHQHMGPEHPSQAFQAVDTDKDGLITYEEFSKALERLNYEEVDHMHRTVHHIIEDHSNALEAKLEVVLKIEEELLGLAATAQKYEDAHYRRNNVGLTTAADIDRLFAQSTLKRDKIGESVQLLKSLIEEAKSVYHHEWDYSSNSKDV